MNAYGHLPISMFFLFLSVALLALQPQTVIAEQTKPASAFSFAVYGDSRPMMYLPPKAGQPDLTKCSSKCSGG